MDESVAKALAEMEESNANVWAELPESVAKALEEMRLAREAEAKAGIRRAGMSASDLLWSAHLAGVRCDEDYRNWLQGCTEEEIVTIKKGQHDRGGAYSRRVLDEEIARRGIDLTWRPVEPFTTLEGAAECLGVTRWALQKAARNFTLDTFKVGNLRLVTQSAVQYYYYFHLRRTPEGGLDLTKTFWMEGW